MLIVFAFGIMVANGGAAVIEYPTKELCQKHQAKVAKSSMSVSECFERESSPKWRISPDPDSIGWIYPKDKKNDK